MTIRTFLRRACRLLPRRGARTRGQIMVILAIAMVPLLGFVGLGVDIGLVVVRHRQLQNGVDAAANAGMRRVANGIPNGPSPFGYTVADVQSAISSYLGANVVSFTVLSADLIWGPGPDADDCLSGPPGSETRVALAAASTNDLWTAHCLQVLASHDYTPFVAQVLPALPPLQVSAVATAAATPVIAMGNLLPMAVSDGSWTLADGTIKYPWGSQWSDENLRIKRCDQWAAAPVPHALSPKNASDSNNCPGSINTDQFKGLLNFAGPRMNGAGTAVGTVGTPSNSSWCHWDNEHDPSESSGFSAIDKPSLGGGGNPHRSWRGFNNPPGTEAYTIPPIIVHSEGALLTHPNWNNSTYRPPTSTAQQPSANSCDSEAVTKTSSIPGWIRYGFNGIINSGDPTVGQGDFYTLINGTIASISADVNAGPCAGVTSTTLFVPLFDAFADPTHALESSQMNPSLHISRFAGFGVDCTNGIGPPVSNIQGSFVQGTVASGAVTGGTRQPDLPTVSVVQMVG